MSGLCSRDFARAWCIGLVALTLFVRAADSKSETDLIGDLASPQAAVVTNALREIEIHYPAGTNAMPAVKVLLTDSRAIVRRKAGRFLGDLHADVSRTDIRNLCKQLTAVDLQEQIDGLISLRGLKAPEAEPDVLASLKSPSPSVIHEACATISVIGGREATPYVALLLRHPDSNVQKDARAAMKALREKK